MATAYREIAEEAPHMTLDTDHPVIGALPLLGSPFVFKRSDGPANRPPPLLAEPTSEVLRSVLGWDEARIAALNASWEERRVGQECDGTCRARWGRKN